MDDTNPPIEPVQGDTPVNEYGEPVAPLPENAADKQSAQQPDEPEPLDPTNLSEEQIGQAITSSGVTSDAPAADTAEQESVTEPVAQEATQESAKPAEPVESMQKEEKPKKQKTEVQKPTKPHFKKPHLHIASRLGLLYAIFGSLTIGAGAYFSYVFLLAESGTESTHYSAPIAPVTPAEHSVRSNEEKIEIYNRYLKADQDAEREALLSHPVPRSEDPEVDALQQHAKTVALYEQLKEEKRAAISAAQNVSKLEQVQILNMGTTKPVWSRKDGHPALHLARTYFQNGAWHYTQEGDENVPLAYQNFLIADMLGYEGADSMIEILEPVLTEDEAKKSDELLNAMKKIFFGESTAATPVRRSRVASSVSENQEPTEEVPPYDPNAIPSWIPLGSVPRYDWIDVPVTPEPEPDHIEEVQSVAEFDPSFNHINKRDARMDLTWYNGGENIAAYSEEEDCEDEEVMHGAAQ